MGSHASAYLFLGFEIYDSGKGDEALPFDINEWEEIYAKRKGLREDDSGLFGADGNYAPGTMEEREERKLVWNKHLDERIAIVKAAGVIMDFHCHHEYPIHYVAIERYSASQGYPSEVPVAQLNHWDANAVEKLKDFCKIMEIPYKQPKWILASYEG